MARLDGYIRAISALIGPGAFVRRDNKGRALFVSDAPRTFPRDRFTAVARLLSQAGYQLQEEQGLLLLDWSMAGYQQFLQQLVEEDRHAAIHNDAASQAAVAGFLPILKRHSGIITPEMLPHFRRAVHLWDLGQTQALLVLAGESLAIALRNKQSPPSFFVPLLTSLLTPTAKEATGC